MDWPIAFGKVAKCDWTIKFNIVFLDNQPEMYDTSNGLNNGHQLQEIFMI